MLPEMLLSASLSPGRSEQSKPSRVETSTLKAQHPMFSVHESVTRCCCPGLQTIAERDALLAAAEQSTRQEAEALEDRRRTTQELVQQAALQEAHPQASMTQSLWQ
jgi:hypothetical protein